MVEDYFCQLYKRKFVWKEEQTTKLFDSLMREYPIGTFLFWDIDTETDDIKGYTFYDFIRNFDVRNELNEKKTSQKRNLKLHQMGNKDLHLCIQELWEAGL